MLEVMADIHRWLGEGKAVALATVVKVWGSAPRPVGSKMAVTAAGDMAGSVSGGCVEGAVFDEAQRVLVTGRPKLLRFGVTDEEAWAVGLACGGEIEIFLEPLPRGTFEALAEALRAERLAALATVVKGDLAGCSAIFFPDGGSQGDLGDDALRAAVASALPERFKSLESARLPVERAGGASEVWIEVYPPPRQLVIIGAVHAAIPLVTFAKTLGYRTVVVDPRGVFATEERFAHADRLLRAWPEEAFASIRLGEQTAVAFLSHDLKLDLPALRLTLRSPAAYLGALGSKKTHAKRVAALKEEGFTEEEIARLNAPIGLPLGGRSPEEIALAVMAEIVAVSHGVRLAAHGL